MMKMLKQIINPNPISLNAIVLVRIIVGAYFIMHGHELFNTKAMEGFAGYLKNDLHFPLPTFMAYLRTSAELFGGIMILLGLFTRIGAFLIMITMLVASFTAGKGDLLGEAEFTFIYATLCFTIILVGAGKFSLDNFLFKRKFNKSSKGQEK
jgi:putative oxidoreductase